MFQNSFRKVRDSFTRVTNRNVAIIFARFFGHSPIQTSQFKPIPSKMTSKKLVNKEWNR